MAIPKDLLTGIERLDPLPATLQKLLRALENENIGPSQVADYVEYDPAVASSVLRLANSAAYGGLSRTDTLRDAVVRLGTTRILDIVLGDHVRRLKIAAPMYDLHEDDIWAHSVAASLAVKALERECPKADIPKSASIGALVHDIGKLVMVRYLKADVDSILALRDARNITFVEAERELFGCDHAEVGGEIATRWGFPTDVAAAIQKHHQVPVEAPSPAVDAVVIANLAAKAIGTGLGAEGMDLAIDNGCHQRLGLDFAGFSRVCIQTMIWLREVKTSYGQ